MVKSINKSKNGKIPTDYNEELMKTTLKDNKAIFIAAYKVNEDKTLTKLDDLSKLNRETIIEFLCVCGKVGRKILRNLHKTGALCKSCMKKQKNEKRENTNIVLYGNICSAQGSKQIELRKKTITKNKETRPPKIYHIKPNEVRLGITNKKGCIYLITCLVNGKQYVGLSKNETPDDRYKEHWHKRNDNSNTKSILHNAMDLYGKDMFTLETLCIISYSALYNMEAYYAEQYGTYIWDNPGGYNMIWCGVQGNLGVPHSAETRAKISEKAKKRSPESIARYSEAAKKRKPQKRSEETKLKMSIAGKAAWNNNYEEMLKKHLEVHKGRKVSEEAKKKMSEARIAISAKKNIVEKIEI